MARPNLTNNPYQKPNWTYPSDLGSVGAEPYMIFEIRDGVAFANVKATLAMYMPPTLKVQYDTKYEDVSIGTQKLIDFGKDVRDHTGDAAWEQIAHLGGNLANLFQKALAVGATIDAESEIELARRSIVNPHMAVLFKGVNFRGFTFEFRMMARSEEESELIRNIIFRFKYHMHPLIGKDKGSRYLIYPDNFIIGLFSPEDKYLFKISTCVLTNMSVDYAGSNVPAFFTKTGAPVDIKMSLTFKELEWMTKDRIQDGY